MQEVLRHADDLDYLQTLVTSLGKKTEINPSVNAVIDAHNRRRFRGRFKTQGQSVELDTLLHKDTKEVPDDSDREGKFVPRKLRCHAFQKDDCTWPKCRFQHLCSICDSDSHGAVSCEKRKAAKAGAQQRKIEKTKPPHPRYRRDRAKD